jgi:hypothetical protein
MSTPPERDEQLSALLRTWDVAPEDDPEMARRIWARIRNAPVSPVRLWLINLDRAFAQPAMVAAALAVFAALGALSAELRFSGRHEAHLDRLAAEYVLAIDPVRMTGHAVGAPPHP